MSHWFLQFSWPHNLVHGLGELYFHFLGSTKTLKAAVVKELRAEVLKTLPSCSVGLALLGHVSIHHRAQPVLRGNDLLSFHNFYNNVFSDPKP